MLNVFLLSNSIKNAREKQNIIMSNSAKVLHNNTNSKANADLFNNNPIDKLFITQFTNPKSSEHMSRVAALYKDAWKSEMNHAYEILLNAAHPNLRGNITQSRDSLINYAENEADVAAAVSASNAFGDLPDKVYYGSISREIRNGTMADIFKQRTIELYEYFSVLGIKTSFLFNKQSIGKDDLELFN